MVASLIGEMQDAVCQCLQLHANSSSRWSDRVQFLGLIHHETFCKTSRGLGFWMSLGRGRRSEHRTQRITRRRAYLTSHLRNRGVTRRTIPLPRLQQLLTFNLPLRFSLTYHDKRIEAKRDHRCFNPFRTKVQSGYKQKVLGQRGSLPTCVGGVLAHRPPPTTPQLVDHAPPVHCG